MTLTALVWPHAERMTGLQRRVVTLCCSATFMDGYDTQALGIAVPRMAEQWSLPASSFAPALSGSLVGLALGAVLLGPLGDRFGRRPTLIGMMLIVGLTTLGAALASDIETLTIWRVITGLGLGGSVPIATALTTEYSPARRRAALVAIMIACMALGSFFAGIITPVLNARWGWQGIFAIGAALPLAMAGILFAALPESLPRSSPSFERDRQYSGASVRDLLSAAYRMRTILVWVIFWFNLFVIYSLISWVPTLLRSAGWAHDSAQRASGLVALGGIVGGILFAWLADRGHATVALFTAYAGTSVLLCLFMVGPSSVLAWIVLLLFVGAGAVGGQMAAGSIAAAYYYPPQMRSTGVGWFNGVSRVGAIVGPLALAGLMRAGWASGQILAFLAVPMLVCAAGVLFLPRALRTTQKF